MTQEQFEKIPFRFLSHISQESAHIANYVSDDGRFVISRITSKHGDEFGKTRIHYRIGTKWYKSKQKFLEALEKEDEMGKKGKVHDLKILPEYFRSVKSGKKTFEVRFNDRNFQKGDILHLREWNGSDYTGESIFVEVTYILDDPGYCKEGYVIMAISKL